MEDVTNPSSLPSYFVCKMFISLATPFKTNTFFTFSVHLNPFLFPE